MFSYIRFPTDPSKKTQRHVVSSPACGGINLPDGRQVFLSLQTNKKYGRASQDMAMFFLPFNK